jgi:uncharacterized protein involved in outer membrane biogenesis
MKRVFRWAIYASVAIVVLLLVVLAAVIFMRERIVKEALLRGIRSQTGLDAKIEKVTINAGAVTIEGLTLYNTAAFGGAPMFKMPELYLEFDLGGIGSRDLHFKQVRLNISEIDVVTDKQGRQNFKALQDKSGGSLADAKTRAGGFTFSGIDTLILTLGKLRISSLNSPDREQEINFGIQNQVFHNIKSEADLGGVGVLLAARSAFSATSSPVHSAEKLLRDLTGKNQKVFP